MPTPTKPAHHTTSRTRRSTQPATRGIGSEDILRLLKGHKVLVMVCCNNSGTSLNFVVSFLRGLGLNGPAEIETAAIYTSKLPSFNPRYVGAVSGRDTKHAIDHIMVTLPWITSHWVESVERLSRIS